MAAVPEDRDIVRYGKHIVEEVRDEDEALAFRLSLSTTWKSLATSAARGPRSARPGWMIRAPEKSTRPISISC
jgi:hypothetical protein